MYEKNQHDRLFIDLDDINVSEVEILTQEGSRGIEHFAASTASCGTCNEGGCSCTIEEPGG